MTPHTQSLLNFDWNGVVCFTDLGLYSPRCPASCSAFPINGNVINFSLTTATSSPSDREDNDHMYQESNARCRTPGSDKKDSSVDQALRALRCIFRVDAICEGHQKKEEEQDGIDDDWKELLEQLLVLLLSTSDRHCDICEHTASEDQTHRDHCARASHEDRKGRIVKKYKLLYFCRVVAGASLFCNFQFCIQHHTSAGP